MERRREAPWHDQRRMRLRTLITLSALAGYVAAWVTALMLDGLDTSQGFGQALLWIAPAVWGVAVAVVAATRLDAVPSVLRGISAAVAAYVGGFLALLTSVAINGTGT